MCLVEQMATLIARNDLDSICPYVIPLPQRNYGDDPRVSDVLLFVTMDRFGAAGLSAALQPDAIPCEFHVACLHAELRPYYTSPCPPLIAREMADPDEAAVILVGFNGLTLPVPGVDITGLGISPESDGPKPRIVIAPTADHLEADNVLAGLGFVFIGPRAYQINTIEHEFQPYDREGRPGELHSVKIGANAEGEVTTGFQFRLPDGQQGPMLKRFIATRDDTADDDACLSTDNILALFADCFVFNAADPKTSAEFPRPRVDRVLIDNSLAILRAGDHRRIHWEIVSKFNEGEEPSMHRCTLKLRLTPEDE